ncbi:hypothetical protein Taro_023956 [Colocasia esculenta]|uniref:Secreted protein n=1 Tax=Colocasia esculenta TaxID=4460 RepID=A0A843VCA9_COLES|nr:hypothetical protein [Colocasia esculenta]
MVRVYLFFTLLLPKMALCSPVPASYGGGLDYMTADEFVEDNRDEGKNVKGSSAADMFFLLQPARSISNFTMCYTPVAASAGLRTRKIAQKRGKTKSREWGARR